MTSFLSSTEIILVSGSIIAKSSHHKCCFGDLDYDKYYQSDALSRNKILLPKYANP